MKIYAVKDDLNAYGLPFYQLNDNLAMRVFACTVRDPGSMVSNSPGDFSLYRLGDYDERTAHIVPHEPEFICRATDLIAKEVVKE